MSHFVKGETNGNLISALPIAQVKVIALGLVGVCLSSGELVTLVALTFLHLAEPEPFNTGATGQVPLDN